MKLPQHITIDDVERLEAARDAAGLVDVLRFALWRDTVVAAHFALVGIGQPAVAPLIAFLRDDLSQRGQRAWWTLMRIGDPAQDQVIECLRSSATAAVRGASVWILGRIGDRSADRDLVRALDDTDDLVRMPAALMLGFRECRHAVPALLRILTDGEFEDPWAPNADQLSLPLPGLQAYGESVPVPSEDQCRRDPLRQAPRFEDLVAACDRTLADDVEAYLEVGSAVTAEHTAWSHGDAIVPRWVTVPLCYWAGEDLRQAAALSLGRIGDPRAVESLIRCAEDESETLELRSYAVGSLGDIGDARGFDAVYGALREETLYEDALSALGGLADRRALHALIRAVTSRDSAVRYSAVGALSRYRDPATLPYLHRVANERDPWLVRQALRGLGELGTQQALETVLARVTHADPEVRRQASAALRWAQQKRLGGRAPSIWHP